MSPVRGELLRPPDFVTLYVYIIQDVTDPVLWQWRCTTSWLAVYQRCLSLVSTLLTTLKYNFLQNAFDFIGVHQDRIHQVGTVPRVDLNLCSSSVRIQVLCVLYIR